VRLIDPAGRISTVSSPGLLVAPTRIAYHPAGWLYVKDASPAGVRALAVSVGRNFTPRQAGRKGPPYGFETDSRHIALRQGAERN